MPLDSSTRCDELRLAVMRSFRHYSTDQLLPLLRNKSPIVRTAAARELHIRGGFLVFQEASNLAASELAQDREIAAFLLGQLGTPHCPYSEESFPILEELMSDQNEEVQCTAISAVGSLATLGKRAPSQLLRRLKQLAFSGQPKQREVVSGILGYFEREDVISTLEKLLQDKDRKVAKEARFSMEAIEYREERQEK